MIFPDFLKEFENELLKYKLEYVKINAKPLKKSQTLSLIQSKFLGKPYLPIDSEYPKDKAGKPMILLAQLNFSEIPNIEYYPKKGILQFYISGDSWYDMEDYKVLFHENVEVFQTNFDFLTEDLYEDSPIYCEHSLAFSIQEAFGGTEDVRFDYKFNGLDYWDFKETLTKKQIKNIEPFFDATGHKIGGYSYFTQNDPRDYDDIEKDLLLLQIDTDDEIMFGDSGVAHFFISKEDLINKRFEKAYFNWDCC
jgi:uncharacterized protein YwqG